jgi:hypothetical protein
MLSASIGRDSSQRASAALSKADSMSYRSKSECAAIMFLMLYGRRQLEPGPVNEITQGVRGDPAAPRWQGR